MVKMDGPIRSCRTPVFSRLTLPANSWWRSKMARHNEQKEANESEIISDREIWSAIRYLDPQSDHRECDIAATVAIVAVIFIVFLGVLLFFFPGFCMVWERLEAEPTRAWLLH